MHPTPTELPPPVRNDADAFRLSEVHPPLTRLHRRTVCVHEAAHAVIYALGGAFVYSVAVAAEGSTGWTTTSRKGRELSELLGVCSAADSPAAWFMRWDETEAAVSVDRVAFRETLRQIDAAHRGAARETRRQLRAHLCALLAGPVAEALHHEPDEAPDIGWPGDSGELDDLAKAEAHSWLLYPRGEFDRLLSVTEETLRRPDVWALVLALADRLEEAGTLEGEALDALLPLPVPDWPPGPRAAARPLPIVTAKGQQ